MKSFYDILLIEDDNSHKELIFRAFEELREFHLSWVANLSQARAFLVDSTPDVIISDWRLADGTGIELSSEVNSVCPFILMTSFGNEELAVKSMKAGVSDYLVKSPDMFRDLPNSIRRVLREWDNITARRQAELALKESEERYRLAAEGSNDVIWDYVIGTGNIRFSGRWLELLDMNIYPTACTLTELNMLIHPDDREIARDTFQKCVNGDTELIELEFRLGLPGHDFKWVHARGKGLPDATGRIIRIAGSLTDITERKRDELKITELAYYDQVTGLPNRTSLHQILRRVLMADDSKLGSGSVFFIDIDNFKTINDAFGHSFGDQVLYQLGRKLSEIDIPGKFLCRHGGDEFVVVADGLSEPETINRAVNLILSCFNTPLEIEENRLYLAASIGVTIYPTDGSTVEEILKNVDAAMYASKTKGKNTVTLFNKSIRQSMYNRIEMEANLRTAIANNEFCLHYQPQIDIYSGRIDGFEALIRWNSPKFGMVPPLSFIKLAEETGMIVPIGYWVFRSACTFAAAINQKHPGTRIWVNLSNIQLMQTDFVEQVMRIIEAAGISPLLLGIEITETMLMESLESSLQKLVQLKEYGLNIAMDDFGTGYSSLNYLKKLPINIVKIDKSFIQDISGNNIEKEITSLIVQLAHKLGLKVVGEGVETEEQLEFLNRYQCDLIQGFLISKPLPEEQVEDFFQQFFLEWPKLCAANPEVTEL